MDRKRRIQGVVLVAAQLLTGITTFYGCVQSSVEETKEAEINFRFENELMDSKAELPDEELITDINLLVFDQNGSLEKSVFLSDGNREYSLSLLKGARYSIYVCANFGYRLQAKNKESIEETEFHLAYPDEYREGMPMYCRLDNRLITEDEDITLHLTRLMSKISLKMDRSRLSEDVEIVVNSVRIGNCPKKSKVFAANKVLDASDCFRIGFQHEGSSCDNLNSLSDKGLSKELSVYMFENLQGEFSEDGISQDQEKVFDEDDKRAEICSFIEIEMDYKSKDNISCERPLIYRFYLGEGINDLNIYRNSHYHITICPEDDGIGGEGWRIDKSGLKYIGETSFEQYPSDYILGNIGDTIHIGCKFTPADTPFDVGEDYMSDDKREGIYDYKIDSDGRGATLTLTGPGRGLIYMEAYEPINESALFIIEVNQPK